MDEEPKKQKEPYEPPTLICYGPIVNLTTGGSGKMQEMTGGMGMGMGMGMNDPMFFP